MKNQSTGRVPNPRKTFAETGKTVRVTLEYNHRQTIGDCPYCIAKIVNEIAVPIDNKSRHVGDFLTELEATELLTEPGLEVTVLPMHKSKL